MTRLAATFSNLSNRIGTQTISRQTPAITADVQKQVPVAKFLKLLANLRFDVLVTRMQFRQLALESMDIGG